MEKSIGEKIDRPRHNFIQHTQRQKHRREKQNKKKTSRYLRLFHTSKKEYINKKNCQEELQTP